MGTALPAEMWRTWTVFCHFQSLLQVPAQQLHTKISCFLLLCSCFSNLLAAGEVKQVLMCSAGWWALRSQCTGRLYSAALTIPFCSPWGFTWRTRGRSRSPERQLSSARNEKLQNKAPVVRCTSQYSLQTQYLLQQAQQVHVSCEKAKKTLMKARSVLSQGPIHIGWGLLDRRSAFWARLPAQRTIAGRHLHNVPQQRLVGLSYDSVANAAPARVSELRLGGLKSWFLTLPRESTQDLAQAPAHPTPILSSVPSICQCQNLWPCLADELLVPRRTLVAGPHCHRGTGNAKCFAESRS